MAAPTCNKAIYRVDVFASLEKRVGGTWVTVSGSPAGQAFYNVKPGRKLTVSTSAPCASGYYRMKATVKVLSRKGASLQLSNPAYSAKMTRDPCGDQQYLDY
ncbi:hypothetical protein F9L07_00945 [Pimelobacter simplex]|uniref:Uncharacterized protein n=1 Tax=Nocardioides simplex TaxID=2045 RepID=A0A7J5DX50_NOCSI|nr:hypothetical protein [Pimelobacter simplex]KAB2810569.1 hypothetical protein F9L07_00945 [Pimelobacter simplex]